MNSKLQRDLSQLLQAEIITPQVEQDISGYYASKKTGKESINTLLIIFGILGSLLVGLGIILILAHNWDQFSRSMKTLFSFVPLVIGQLIAAYALFKKKGAAWREGAATFLFFAIGASISLISQVYNIPGSMQVFLLTWILLAAPLIYLLRSHAASILYLLFITIYACNVGYFNDMSPWWYLALLLAIIPHYYMQIKSAPKSVITSLYHWLIPLSVLISLGAFVSGEEFIGFLMYISLFGLFYNLGKLPYFQKLRLRTNGYLLLGSLGTVVTLMFMTFNWMWNEFDSIQISSQDTIITVVLALSALGVLGFLHLKKHIVEFNVFQYAFIIFGMIYFMAPWGEELATILTNILVFGLGIFAIKTGAKKERYSILNYGLLIITSLITCRFFDMHISFVFRGLIFVAIGVGFFVANYLMHKKQQKLNTENYD